MSDTNVHWIKKSRANGVVIIALTLVFNEWAFRFIFPLEPIDGFLRLMALVLDGFVAVLILSLVKSNVPLGNWLKQVLSIHSKSTAIFIGIFMAFFMMMIVEFGCRYYFKHVYQPPYSESTNWSPSAYEFSPVFGTAPPLSTNVGHTYTVNDTLVYDLEYRIDSLGRRFTPKTDSSYQEFIAVTGCSFAFGYGLNESSTLSYFLDSLTGFRAYNYGFYGYGTQQTLALLQARKIHQEIEESNGVLIHLFIDDHLARLIGTRRMMKLWGRDFPYYALQGDSAVNRGHFWADRPLLSKFYKAISESAFIDLFDIDFPWYTSDKHLELFARVLKQSQAEFIKQFPEGRFLVVIAPNSKLEKRVEHVLQNHDVEVLNLSKLLDKEKDEYKIHWTEAHPNARYYRKVAQAIDAYLDSDKANSQP